MIGIHLVRQVAASQSQIGADMFVDGPRKLIIELVSIVAEKDSDCPHEDGHRNGDRLSLVPKVGFDQCSILRVISPRPRPWLVVAVVFESILNLIILHSSFNKEPQVVYAKANDLNGVF